MNRRQRRWSCLCACKQTESFIFPCWTFCCTSSSPSPALLHTLISSAVLISRTRTHTHTHTHTHTASGSFFIWRLCCIPPPHLSLSRSLFISISSSPSLLPPLPHVPQPHILLLHHHPSLLTRLPPLKTALSSPFYPSSCFLLIFTPCVPLANHRPFTFALALSPSVECLHRPVIKNSCRGRTGCNQVTPLTPVRHLFPSAGPRLRRWSERPLTPVAQELNWAAACRNRMHGGRFHDCGLL